MFAFLGNSCFVDLVLRTDGGSERALRTGDPPRRKPKRIPFGIENYRGLAAMASALVRLALASSITAAARISPVTIALVALI